MFAFVSIFLTTYSSYAAGRALRALKALYAPNRR